MESHTLPSALACGETLTATVTVRNTGTTTWTRDDGYKLGTVDDADPLHPGSTRERLPAGVSVAPGQTYTFDVPLTAPGAAGDVVTDWQMVREGVHWFGEQVSQDVSISCSDLLGPLVVSTANPRYFEDPQGNAVWLGGSHTWDNRQDWGAAFPDFNWTGYLDLLTAHGHNFIRLWVHEGTSNGGSATCDVTPQIYETDASGRFDLTQLNDAFFTRLRTRVQEAAQRGIYVGVMLFQGWSIRHVAWDYYPWPYHPYNAANNINGINGDPGGDGDGEEVHTLAVPAITALQEAYVERVVDTLNDLDNVLWEVANESHAGSIAWQEHIISHVRTYEATLPKQHPVGLTYPNDAANATLFSSSADWISPGNHGGEDWGTDPPENTGNKIVLCDNDHITSVLGSTSRAVYRHWIWKSFLQGHHVILMDAIQNPWPGMTGHPATDPNNVGLQAAREYLGDVLQFAGSVDLLAMEPSGHLSTTGYCLADPGASLLVYQPQDANFTVTLDNATWSYEWFNPVNHSAQATGTVDVTGGAHGFTPPFSANSYVLLLWR